jgi:AcrR family transcriptional regulator
VAERDQRPRRGRQAEAERNDRLVLDAAREVFATQGFDAPVSAVAERAGVGMGSLYRRYGSKTELLNRLCVLAMEQAIGAARVALAAEDAWSGLTGYVRTCVAFGSGALAPLAGTIETTPEMWEISRHGRELLDAVVARAHREGGLRPDVTTLDVAWLIEQFSRARPARPGPEEDNVQQRLLAIALDGLRAGQPEPLPGTPPSPTHYEGRWRYEGPKRA